MPARDGTGPEGRGSKTGRQLGNCEGAQPIGRGFGRGFGRGQGRGFGRGYWCRRPIVLSKEEEKKILEAELKELDLEKKEIEKRLKEV